MQNRVKLPAFYDFSSKPDVVLRTCVWYFARRSSCSARRTSRERVVLSMEDAALSTYEGKVIAVNIVRGYLSGLFLRRGFYCRRERPALLP